jgi:uncharacterized protein YdeI (YjbR/CyaY-like superfamily)
MKRFKAQLTSRGPVASAKQEATRQSRAEKSIAMVLAKKHVR